MNISSDSDFSGERPGYFSIKQTAEHFGVSERTIFNWRRDGFPVVAIRGRRLVPINRAEVWLNQYLRIQNHEEKQ